MQFQLYLSSHQSIGESSTAFLEDFWRIKSYHADEHLFAGYFVQQGFHQSGRIGFPIAHVGQGQGHPGRLPEFLATFPNKINF